MGYFLFRKFRKSKLIVFVIFLLIVSGIFTFVTEPGCFSFIREKNNVSVTDFKLEQLLTCLAEVDRSKVHVRGSGNRYIELNWQWNTLNGYLEPLVYLVATSVADIQKAVICCRSSKVRIVARSGGHSFVKNGFGDSRSLIVDVASMNQIYLNRKRMQCEIEAGARNGHISYILWKEGFLISQGICPTVGIAGLTLGGGLGHFSRLFGLASDNLIEVEMVDAKGNLRVINNTTDEDLFWALRGGGGGNFGIVSKFTFKMHPAPKSIVYGRYQYSFIDFVPFYTAYQSLLTSGIPNNICCLLYVTGDFILMMLYAFNGRNLKKVSVNSMDRLYKSFGFPAATNTSIELLSHSEFILTEAQLYSPTLLTHPSQLVNMTELNHSYFSKTKSFYYSKILSKEEIYMFEKLLDTCLQYASLITEFVGGAINNFSPSQTAYIHRGENLFQMQLSSAGKQLDANADSAMKTFFEESKAIFNHSETYQNYLDQDLPDFLTRYYGTNLIKLIHVKRLVDPENIFHYPQSIPLNIN